MGSSMPVTTTHTANILLRGVLLVSQGSLSKKELAIFVLRKHVLRILRFVQDVKMVTLFKGLVGRDSLGVVTILIVDTRNH